MSTPPKARWSEFGLRLGPEIKKAARQIRPAGPIPERYFAGLAVRYSEPHRAYHNLAHVVDCLEQFEPAKDLAHDAIAVEMALWYHDVIYDPRAKDNEERSAELAGRVADDIGLPGSFKETVMMLILATKKHDASLAPDAGIMVDVDLSILGRDPLRFDEYERQIRQEYSWVPDDAFAAGRSAVLETFLARPVIYQTKFFREKYETQARENMKRSVQRLRRLPC